MKLCKQQIDATLYASGDEGSYKVEGKFTQKPWHLTSFALYNLKTNSAFVLTEQQLVPGHLFKSVCESIRVVAAWP